MVLSPSTKSFHLKPTPDLFCGGVFCDILHFGWGSWAARCCIGGFIIFDIDSLSELVVQVFIELLCIKIILCIGPNKLILNIPFSKCRIFARASPFIYFLLFFF